MAERCGERTMETPAHERAVRVAFRDTASAALTNALWRRSRCLPSCVWPRPYAYCAATR
jgi:hypothetical protein